MYQCLVDIQCCTATSLQPCLSINTRSRRRFQQGRGVSSPGVRSVASVLKLAPGWILMPSQLQAGPLGHVSGAA